MNPIQIFGSGTLSRSTNVTSTTLVNMYLEITDDGTVAYGTPGLSPFTDFGSGAVRGMMSIEETIYAVHGGTFYTINNAGLRTSRGALVTSSGLVSIASNGLQVMVVDGTKGYIYTISSTAWVQITDVDFPASKTVVFSDSFFIVNKNNSAQFHLSASYNGLAWDGLDFATAESSPDNLVAVATTQSRLVLFGVRSIEHWAATGGVDFPYTRISGATSDFGLAAIGSVADFNGSLIFLAQGRQGEVQVCWLAGYVVTRVSTHDIEALLNAYSGVSDAVGFSYMNNGHQFYQLNFTAANKSWLYDGSTQAWSELKTGTSRHEGNLAVDYLGTVKVSGYSGGNIYTIDNDVFTDNGTPILSSLTTRHIPTTLARLSISELQVDCETGVGISVGQGVLPRMMMQSSKDYGHTWGNVRLGDMGAIGEHKARARWLRLGQSRGGWTVRISISDPVKRVIKGIFIL